ncbi:MAG: DUF951 domain-containing protein [Clostridia bacterium]|nr:DUF951 domain-containing protein [Clostridia bacterium]MDH7573368.1 DUF951 domain-containing protein [Clostridia bacterium]
MPRYALGDVVRLKKPHPCGSDTWEIVRTGMDFRLRCLGCGHQVLMPRPKFEKSVKALVAKTTGGKPEER